jgi:uncharacterized RDD family membrane protein YckC
MRRDTRALSTLIGQAELSTLWKHEVSQRVAAHRKRKGSLATDAESQSHSHGGEGSRRSGAAARVAARYAAAPSYSDFFAGGVSSAPKQLEPAAEQIMLLDMGIPGEEARQDSASVEQPRASIAEAAPVVEAAPMFDSNWGFGDDLAVAVHHPLSEALERESHRASRDVDEHAAERTIVQAQAPADPWQEEVREPSWREPAESGYAEAHDVFVVDAQPIHGNLIEFPVELIAARKVRPRRAEGIYGSAAEGKPQLSIFEVDPASVSTQPYVLEQPAETPGWSGPEWADLKLEASQRREPVAEHVVDVTASKTVELQAAPMNLRILAAVVDFGLVSIVFLTVAILVAVNAAVLPTIREAEIGGGLVFAAIAFAYLAISYTLARATPGMKYALISLRTFDGRTPTREQRCRRLGALALSMLPVGLGAVWALFDEQHLSWHDRWSGTYLRRV